MPSKKSAPRWHAAPAVEARPSTVEEAETLAVAPVAEAIEVPAVDATPNQGAGGHKRSRVYEVFEADALTPPTQTTCSASAGRASLAAILAASVSRANMGRQSFGII